METKEKKSPAKVGIQIGSVLSETSFYVVKSVDKNGRVVVNDDNGHEIALGDRYVKEICVSADHYESEEKKTMTELAELFISSPRIAMTVAFVKKDTAKTATAYKAEKATKINQIKNAKVSEIEGLLSDLIENPLSKVIPGGTRVMKGRHFGHVDELGRVHFIDMELDNIKKTNKEGELYDTRKREVDPRTLQYLIVNKVKYVLK